MKSSSHGRYTSANSVPFRFTLSLILITTLVIPAAFTLAAPGASIQEIFFLPGIGRAAILEPTLSAAVAHRSAAPMASDPIPQPLPYDQDFSSLDHSSTAYLPGWQGSQTGTGGSGGTFKTVDPTADLALLANGSASSTAGAVHNFNGKIGTLSTGSVDPSLVLAVDTTGYTGVTITFDVMTIRNPYNGTTNTRISEVDLQYRICSSLPCAGAFASASVSPGVYQNNTAAQTSGTAPQKSETKIIALPAAVNNQANVQLRWVQRDVSGGGSRPSFAVDSISITGAAACTGPVVTLDPSGQTVTYGDSSAAFTSTAHSDPAPAVQWEVDTGSGFLVLVNGDNVSGADTTTLTISSPHVAMTGYAYRAVFTNECGGAQTATSTAANLTVDPLTITVTPDPGHTKVYGDLDPELTFGHSPDLIGSDSISGSLARVAGEAVGSHDITMGSLALNSNYVLSFAPGGALQITPKTLVATIVANNKIYDGTTDATFSCLLAGIVGSDDVSCTGGSAAFASRNVGTHVVSATGLMLSGASAFNYTANTNDTGTGDISVRPITVTAVAATKAFDGNVSSSGIPVVAPELVDGDTPNFFQTYDTPAAGIGKTLTPSGSASDGNAGANYAYTFLPVTTGVITATFCFDGFHGPIGGSVENGNGGSFTDPVKAFKLNSTIPIKFTLFAGGCNGSPIVTGIHTLQMIKYANAVDSEPAIDATPTDAATTGNQFRLTETDWVYNLDTKRTAGMSSGTWLIKATLFDGSVRTAWISIKK